VVVGVIVVALSINSLTSLSISMPDDISTKSLIKSALNINQTAVKETVKTVGISLGLAFSGMLVAAILIVNGIIALIGGTVVSFADRRNKKVNKTQQHLGSPIG
jgi:hypothetical protein